MPRPSLKSQAAKRKAAAEAKKATKTTTKSTATKTRSTVSKTSSPGLTTPKVSSQVPSTLVPGLTTITPNDVAGIMPQFDGSNYDITDPLKPPSNIPQISEVEFDSGMRIYQGALRALQLTGTAFDVTRERFTTEGKKAKAFGAGVKAATEFERVKGDYIDYLTQLETTTQKESGLSLAQKRTQFVLDSAVESESEMAEKLETARIGAELARLQRQDKQTKLDEFLQQLTGGN